MKSKTKNYRTFIRQCKVVSFQFKEMVLNDRKLKRQLYNEFIQTEREADYNLFLQKYYSIYEIDRGLHEKESSIIIGKSSNEVIFSEYKELLGKRSLPESFYSHQLKETKTVKILIEIEKEIDLLKEWVLEEKRAASEMAVKAEGFTINLKIWLSKLESEYLKNEIIDEIINDKKNIYAEIHEWRKVSNDGVKRYHDFKDYININLSKLKELEQPAAPERPDIEAVEEKKGVEIKLGLCEIALFNYYTDTKITPNNSNEKAGFYGQKCGQKLLEHYNLISKDSLNITGHRFAVKYLKNVISLLNNFPKGKEKAEKDLKIAEYKKN